MREPRANVKVPSNLEECFEELKRILSAEELSKFKAQESGMHVPGNYLFGMWLRNNWGLWLGSELAKYFNKMGVIHPDDMCDIILESFWHHLNGTDIHLEEKIQRYKRYSGAVF